MSTRKALRTALNGIELYRKYRYYMKSQYFSQDRIRELQLAKLRRIAWTAVHQVPFYAGLQGKIDFDRFSFEELRKFPLVDKKLIRSRYSDFLVTGVDERHLTYKQTSGSSGSPFRVPKCYLSDAEEGAIQFRAFSMGDKYVYRPRDPLLAVRTYAPRDGEPIYKRDRLRNYWYLSAFHINAKTLPEYLEVIERSGSRILKGYSSSLYILTHLLQETRTPRPKRIDTLVSSSESVLPQHRRLLEQYWGIPLIDWYGQNERTVTAQQCSCGNYLNNDEYGYLELDEKNQVIATSLNNDVMPLIRYCTGDIAVPSPDFGKPCKGCGRGLSIAFLGIQGRADDILVKNDGTLIPSVNIYTAMDEFRGIKQFKMVQHRDRAVDLYLCEQEKLDEAYLDRVKESIRLRMGEVPIRIEIVGEIARDPRTEKLKVIESAAAREMIG